MSTALVQRARPGRIYGHYAIYPKHAWIWRGRGAAPTPARTTLRHPWLLYRRFGGVHGQFFVWDRGLTGGGAGPTPGAGIGAIWLRRRRRQQRELRGH